MRTVEILHLQGKIEDKARELRVPPQMMLRSYLLDRLLERISVSPWREKIVFKGDMLVGTLLGTRRRTSKNPVAPAPAVISGFNLTVEDAESIFASLVATDVGDEVSFSLLETELIRDAAEYPGVRAHLQAEYGPMRLSFSVDMTAAEAIVPDTLAFGYALTFENRYISLFTYPPALCLAEKLEAIISRGPLYVRMRDYYDVFALWRTRCKELDPRQVRRALHSVAEERGTLEAMDRYRDQMRTVAESALMQQQWEAYQARCELAQGITLSELCALVRDIMKAANWSS